MSIARGVRKAAKAAKKQSRGLTGNRNSQGDFMPADRDFYYKDSKSWDEDTVTHFEASDFMESVDEFLKDAPEVETLNSKQLEDMKQEIEDLGAEAEKFKDSEDFDKMGGTFSMQGLAKLHRRVTDSLYKTGSEAADEADEFVDSNRINNYQDDLAIDQSN